MRNWLRNDSDEQVQQINDSDKQVYAISDSEKLVGAGSDPKSDPSSDPKVDTHTTNGNLTQKLLIIRFFPKIIPVVIGLINPLVTTDVVDVQDILSLRQTVPPKASVTDAACSCVRIFRTPGKKSCTYRDDSMPRDVNCDENSRLISPIPGSNPNSVSPELFRNQEVISPRNPSIAKRGRNADPFDAPIDGSLAVNGHSTSYFSGVIGLESVPGEVTNVNESERMNFASNSVLGKTPKFVDLGISPANTEDKLNSVFATATRSIGLIDKSDWLTSRHGISEVTEGRASEKKMYSNYIKNSEFETMNVFEREIFH